MTLREISFILLLASVCVAACTTARFPGRPDLPASVSPAWTLKSLDAAGAPSQDCWKGNYANAGTGSAEVLVCGFTSDAGALDAMQGARATANTVKFLEGRRLALVTWNGASRDEVKALVISLQKSLQ